MPVEVLCQCYALNLVVNLSTSTLCGTLRIKMNSLMVPSFPSCWKDFFVPGYNQLFGDLDVVMHKHKNFCTGVFSISAMALSFSHCLIALWWSLLLRSTQECHSQHVLFVSGRVMRSLGSIYDVQHDCQHFVPEIRGKKRTDFS